MACWGSPPEERRRRSFVQVPTAEQVEELVITEFSMDPKKRYKASIWIHAAIGSLGVGTLLFLVAFLTIGWGVVEVQEGMEGTPERWHFGMWLCCREEDGLCVGPRWPVYYSVVRSFAVLSLFGHMLSLAWMIGYALEQLLEYDPCGLISFMTLTFVTATLALIQVCVFGAFWADDMRTHDFRQYRGIRPSLDYSFYLSLIDIFFILLAGVCQVIEMKVLINRLDREADEGELRDNLRAKSPVIVRRRSKDRRSQAIPTVCERVTIRIVKFNGNGLMPSGNKSLPEPKFMTPYGVTRPQRVKPPRLYGTFNDPMDPLAEGGEEELLLTSSSGTHVD